VDKCAGSSHPVCASVFSYHIHQSISYHHPYSYSRPYASPYLVDLARSSLIILQCAHRVISSFPSPLHPRHQQTDSHPPSRRCIYIYNLCVQFTFTSRETSPVWFLLSLHPPSWFIVCNTFLTIFVGNWCYGRVSLPIVYMPTYTSYYFDSRFLPAVLLFFAPHCVAYGRCTLWIAWIEYACNNMSIH